MEIIILTSKKIFESIGVKEMLRWRFWFDCQGIVYYDFIPEGKIVNNYTGIIRPLGDAVRRKRPE